MSNKSTAPEITAHTTGHEESSYLELAYSSIKIFANDGTVDVGELNFLLGLALRDGIDDEERRVLANIFDHAEKTPLSVTVRSRIREARRKHSI